MDDLNRAIPLWLGWGDEAKAVRRPSRVLEELGPEGYDLIPVMEQFVDELLSIGRELAKTRPRRSSMAERDEVVRLFAQEHPDLGPEALNALGWDFYCTRYS